MIEVRVGDGKYTVILPEGIAEYDAGIKFRALRYEEEWRDLCGDNLVYCLASELHEAREEIKRLNPVREPVTPIPGSGTY